MIMRYNTFRLSPKTLMFLLLIPFNHAPNNYKTTINYGIKIYIIFYTKKKKKIITLMKIKIESPKKLNLQDGVKNH